MSDQDNDKTRLIRRPGGGRETDGPRQRGGGGDDEETVYGDGPGRGGAGEHADSERTAPLDRGQGHGVPEPPKQETRILPETPVAQGPDTDDRTILVGPVKRSKGGGEDEVQPPRTGAPAGDDADAMPADGPVVGWLVVTKGPGRGRAVRLGYGMNEIGRDPRNRAALPFGDEQISRTKHAILTYDPRGRKFFLQQGDSVNLTYVGDEPVLSPKLLEGGESIMIGDTQLRFVPLCGEDFQWEDAL